jgi:hypothetical protein
MSMGTAGDKTFEILVMRERERDPRGQPTRQRPNIASRTCSYIR